MLPFTTMSFRKPFRLMKNSYAHIIIKIINHFNITCFVPHGINPLRLRDMLMQLENLNHVSREPLLFLIWEKIALLADTRNSFQVRSEAAATLGEISWHDCEHSIIEEGGVEPLVGEGPVEGQENVVRTLGSLGHAWESVEHVILADACKVWAKILREGPMKVQAAVAWAVSEIAARHPKCRDVFNSYAHIIIKIINHFNITCFVPHDINPLRLRDMLMQLENVIGDVSWLTILLSSVNSEDMDWSQLNHVSREPLLFLIWEKIALLADTRNSFQVRSEAAATLGEISRHDCEHSIIEEGGVEPLLKFVGEGPIESQENAVRTLGSLGHAWESVEHVILADACKVWAKILREGPMKVQAAVAWAVSEIAARHPKCRDVFLSTDYLVMQNHKYGISPERLMENENLLSFFKILTTCTDEDDKVYVSTVHAYNYLATAFQ
ncbi:hypothetical protein C1H46_033524 [Malus baccata]|uniref:Uncharacterized protein n=1 Tax=Malus baccata TaxID=106549 RepID=A0A540L390_MALBA|nr:hypothetical protein C1H46_033524 [Malus baccata]